MTRRGSRRTRTDLDLLLDGLPAICLVVGKGGVGKTTCAAGIAAHLARRGERTLLVSTDPAGALAGALGLPLENDATTEVSAVPGLVARQLDAGQARRSFLARWRETLVAILDRGTYLDVSDIEGFVDAAFPGTDEIFALLMLAQLVARRARGRFADGGAGSKRLVVDTAPTGHTLRLLALPETFDALIALLESMQAKHRFMVGALTRRYRRDQADDFLDEMRETMGALRSAMADGESAGALLVARPEPVVVAETARYAEALRAMNVRVAGVVVNGVDGVAGGAASGEESEASRRALREIAGEATCYELPLLDPPPRGLEDIQSLLELVRPAEARVGDTGVGDAREGLRAAAANSRSLLSGGPPAASASLERTGGGASIPASLLRTLTITGGKGGVGKTTISCALAIAAADSRPPLPVLLISADPAPSIADALGIPDSRWARQAPEPVGGVDGLLAWQMDATLAFIELRDRFRDRIDALFGALVGRGLDIAHDRAILRDLFALAPPGVDELYALAFLGEALGGEPGNERYACVIVDAAPTGHLLRLLEMPALALDWTHRLMRLMLKYREVAGLGEAAADLVAFSRRTRALEALLHDPERCGIVLVTLDEPLVHPESARLARALGAARLSIAGTVTNRAGDGAAPLLEGTPCYRAPRASFPLVGPDAIRRWSRSWLRCGSAMVGR